MGREWRLEIDSVTARMIQEDRGINLLGADGSAWIAMGMDLLLTVDVLWTVCGTQAVEAGVDARSFARGLVGDAIDDAIEALQQAALQLFSKPRRKQLQDLIRKNRELHEEGVQQMLDKFDSDELRQSYRDAIDRQFSESVRRLLGGQE